MSDTSKIPGFDNLSDQQKLELLDSILQQSPGGQAEPSPELNSGLGGDAVDMFQRGALQGVGGLLSLADEFTGYGAGGAKYFQEQADQQLETLSPQGQEALGKEVFTRDENGNLVVGEGMNPRTVAMLIAQGGGTLAPSLIGGGGAGLLARATGAGRFAGAASTAGFGVTGGGMAQGMAGEEARGAVMQLPDEKLYQSQSFLDLWQSDFYDPSLTEKDNAERVRAELADEAASQVMRDPELAAVNFGSNLVMGKVFDGLFSGVMGKSRLMNMGIGGATEAGEEFVQEGASALKVNEALRDIDPSTTDDNVLPQALTGMIAGFGTGAPLGAMSPVNKAREDAAAAGGDALEQELAASDAWAEAVAADRRDPGRINTDFDIEGENRPSFDDAMAPLGSEAWRDVAPGRRAEVEGEAEPASAITDTGLDADIEVMRRVGDKEGVDLLQRIKKTRERAQTAKAAGRESMAQRLYENADLLYQELLGDPEYSEWAREGEFIRAEQAKQEDAQRSGQTYQGALAPEPLGVGQGPYVGRDDRDKLARNPEPEETEAPFQRMKAVDDQNRRAEANRAALMGEFPAPNPARIDDRLQREALNQQQDAEGNAVRADDRDTPLLDHVREQGIDDDRLAFPEYRNRLLDMASQLEKGQNRNTIADEEGYVVGRAPSINPDWYKGRTDLGGVDDVKAAVKKALRGEKLGARQARAVSAMMDAIEDESANYGRTGRDEWESLFDSAAFEKAIDPDDPAGLDGWIPVPDGAYLFDEGTNAPLRTIAMLWDEALDRGISQADLEAIDARTDTTEQLAREIHDAIQGNTQAQPGRDNGRGREDQTQASGDAQGPRAQASEAGSGSAEQGADQEVSGGGLLSSYTEAELQARAEAERAAREDEAKRQRDEEAKAQADAEAGDFRLSGSNQPADIAAAGGQADLLGASSRSDSTKSGPQSGATAGSDNQSEQGAFKPLTTKQALDRALIRNADEIDEYNQLAEQYGIGADKHGANIVALRNARGVSSPKQDIRGEKIDDEWTAFSDDSGTLKIPRANMPQVKAEHRGALANFLKARGIKGTESTEPADNFKPTQAEFSPAKVEKAKAFTGGDRAILVSRDNHVVDGHHQWLAKRDQGEDIKVIRLDGDIRDLLELVKQFPSAEVDQGADGAGKSDSDNSNAEFADLLRKRYGYTGLPNEMFDFVANEPTFGSESYQYDASHLPADTQHALKLFARGSVGEVGGDRLIVSFKSELPQKLQEKMDLRPYGESRDEIEAQLTPDQYRKLKRENKLFRELSKKLNQPDPSSSFALTVLRGWLDAQSGRSEDRRYVTKRTPDMWSRGFNPIDGYRSGYETYIDGEPLEIRVVRGDSDSSNTPPAAPSSDSGQEQSAATLTKTGKPFKSEKMALATAKRNGVDNPKAVPVDGGWGYVSGEVDSPSQTPSQTPSQSDREYTVDEVLEARSALAGKGLSSRVVSHGSLAANQGAEVAGKVFDSMVVEGESFATAFERESSKDQFGAGVFMDVLQKVANSTENNAEKASPAAKQNGYGQSNKLFTQDAAEKARALLRSKLGQLNSGLDPEMVQAGITLAGYHIEAGARKFADFARAMIADLGDGAKPYLRSWYEGVRYYPGMDNTGMSPSSEADGVDLDNLEVVDAERATGDQERDSEGGDGKPPAAGDIRNAGRGPGRSGASAAGRESDESRISAAAMGDRGADDVGKRGDKPVRSEKSRLENDAARDTDNTGSLPDSTGRLSAESGATQGLGSIVEQAHSRKPVVGEPPANQKSGDLAQIKQQMPFLTDGQAEDVVFAEKRFAKDDGYGVLFTNGTGTGKTFTGLGVLRRAANEGKTNVLIAVPKQAIADAWVKAGEGFFDLTITLLKNTKDAGSGIVVTTFANLAENNALMSRDWDLFVMDEAHYLSSDQVGSDTKALQNLRALSLKSNTARDRIYALHSDMVAEMQDAYSKAESYRKSDNEQLWHQVPSLEEKGGRIAKELSALVEAEQSRINAIPKSELPRAVFLSATPFAYEKNVQWGQEFLFDWRSGKEESGAYNAGGDYEQFMMTHFGYRMRYNKLTEPEANVDRGLMQRSFNTWLKKEGALSGRALDSDYDYDRLFVLTENALGRRVDQALDWLRDSEGRGDKESRALSDLHEEITGRFDYHSRMYFLEAIKAKESLPIIQAHLDMGRKVLVMHDFKKGGITNPFILNDNFGTTEEAQLLKELYAEFKAEFSDLINAFSALPSPIQTVTASYPDALIYNGDISAKKRIAMQEEFNSDEPSAPNVMVAQGDAMREGVSIHDTTGKSPRVLIHLGMPVKPTAAIQQEGRIYRTGQASDAMFRYLTIGTNWERMAFASKIASRASAAENLAMGEGARGLKESFIQAYEDAGPYPPGFDGEGKGGKEADQAFANVLTPWDMAKSFYFGTKKQGKGRSSRGREHSEFFATPEPLGLKMVQWADIREGESTLEPSAGHGAIARWLPETTKNRAIEYTNELSSKLALHFDGDLQTGDFLEHNIVNKYNAIVMNPPFGAGGADAVKHVEKAMKHLADGGRIVALIPSGPAADKKFDKLLYGNDASKDFHIAAEIKLPNVTFERAGTNTRTRVLVIEKQTDAAAAQKIQQEIRDYSDAQSIGDFFDRLETSEIAERVEAESSLSIAIKQERERTRRRHENNAKPEGERSGIETWETQHSKSGETLYMAKVARNLNRDEYRETQALAKQHGGYWSRFAKGFLFDSDDKRAAFISAFDGDSGIVHSRSARRVEASAKGVGLGAARIAIAKFLKQYKGADDVTIKVFRTYEEAHGKPAPFRTKGGYDPESDTLFIYTGALDSVADLNETLRHEILVHKGLGMVEPAKLKQLLSSLREATKDSRVLKRILDDVERVEAGRTDAVKAEEMLARIAEDRLSLPDKIWNRIVLALQRALAPLGLWRVDAYRQARDVVYRIGDAFVDGKRARRRDTDAMFNQSAYHGSPHEFDTFSLDAIGSGEGAQAYGWGLYFAGKRAVAEYYRDLRGTGSIYQADIPEDSELLDYNLPLDKQPPKVRAALEGLPAAVAEEIEFLDGVTSQKTDGGGLYDIVKKHAGSAKKASELLDGLGIPGIRYSDAGSRIIGGKDGTYNYVIWDESRVTLEAVNDEIRQAQAMLFSRDSGPESPAWQRAKAKGLDMSKAARMKRALDMGYIANIEDVIVGEIKNGKIILAKVERSQNDARNLGYSQRSGRGRGSRGIYPQTFYHGTAGDFDQFDTGHPDAKDEGFLGKGVYLSTTPGLANSYANVKSGPAEPNVMPLMVRGSRFLRADLAFKRSMQGFAFKDKAYIEEVTTAIQAQGYDGIILEFNDTAELVVFDPANIRSVNAAFDPDEAGSSNILYSRSAELSPEREAVLSKIGMAPDRRSSFQKVKDALRDWWREVSESFIPAVADKFHDLKKINAEAYMRARMSTNTGAALAAALGHATPEWHEDGILQAKRGSKGLLDILKPIEGDVNEWVGWMVGKRAERLAAEDRENLLTEADIAELLDVSPEQAARFQQVADEWREYNGAMLDLMAGGGLITQESADHFKQDPYYIPFYREVVDETGEVDVAAPFTKRGLSHQKDGIEALKGGASNLQDPLKNMLMNVTRAIDASVKNNALRRIVDEVDVGAEGAVLSVAHEGSRSGNNVIRVRRDGENEYYRVHDLGVLGALTAMNDMQTNTLTRALGIPKRLLTAGVTATPTFMLRNAIRDITASWMQSEDVKWQADKAMGQFADALKIDDDTIDMMMAGSAFMGGYRYSNDATSNAQALREQLRAKGMGTAEIDGYMSSLFDGSKRAWEWYREKGERFENMSRLKLFKDARESGLSYVESAYRAKDLMDFSLHGRAQIMHFLIQTVPFMNARIQGLYKLGRVGANQKNMAELSQMVAFKGAMLAAATLALYALNEDDDDYQALPDWDKDANWHIFLEGEHLRIPKPFELGLLFSTIPERAARLATGDDDSRAFFKSVGTNVIETLSMNPMPQALMPAVEGALNYDVFRGRAIDNQSDMGNLPGSRKSVYTSEVAKGIGGLLEEAGYTGDMASPKRIDHIIKGYTGSMGISLLSATDAVIHMLQGTTMPAMNQRDYPVLGWFARGDDPAQTRYGDEFYRLMGRANQAYRTIRDENTDDERRSEIASEYQPELRARRMLSSASKRLSKLRKQRDAIYLDDSMSPTEKRERLNNIQSLMNEIQRRSVDRVESLRE